MKTWLIPAVALSVLLASPAAFAAPQDQNGANQQDRQDSKATKGDRSQRNNSDNGNKRDVQTRGNDNGNRNAVVDRNARQNRIDNSNRNAVVDRSMRQNRMDNSNSNNANNSNAYNRRNNNRTRNAVIQQPVQADRSSQRNRNFDVKTVQGNFSSPHHYHYSSYRQPSGWYSHHWGYGERLPRDWYGRDYWLTSFLMFGLMEPPYGYVWVREGDDALLVDTETGEVVRVEYDVFY